MILRAVRAPKRELPLLAAALLGAVLCLISAHAAPRATAAAYLSVWLFFLGLSLGALGALLMHHLTGGGWSEPVHRYFACALAPLPLLTLLFVPVALGAQALFPWVSGSWGTDIATHFKSDYLTRAGFLLRAGLALAAWNILALLIRRGGERSPTGVLTAAGLIVYALSMSWAAVDWVGSLEPRWSSSALGLVIITAQGLGAFAFASLCATSSTRGAERPTAQQCGDLGNLLLTFLMTWMYLAFTQFLIVWAEDLPRETVWFLPRLHGLWLLLGILVILGQFAVPFTLLLLRPLKRAPSGLRSIAALVLLSNWLYACWLILPSVPGTGPQAAWPVLFATAAIGGSWALLFRHALATSPAATPALGTQPASPALVGHEGRRG